MIPADIQSEIIKTAVQIIVENTIKYFTPFISNLGKMANSEHLYKAPRVVKSDFVGQMRVRQSIDAVLSENETTRIIYLQGDGGTGKTRLLEETQGKIQDNGFRWAGIFDLYHSELHDILQLQSAIANSLDAGNYFFKDFRDAQVQFNQKRRDGIFASTGANIHSELVRLNQIFFGNLNQVSSHYRVVIAFDTLENIMEWTDAVQKFFGQEWDEEGFTVEQWLLELARSANNTVVLLAGRPNDELTTNLSKINTGTPGRFELIKIEKLTRHETGCLLKLYIREFSDEIEEVILTNSDRILDVIEGSPVRLALLVELLIQNLLMVETIQQSDTEKLNSEIIQAFFKVEDRRPMFFLALARKGLSPELLHYLQPDWPEPDCAECIVELQQMALVKNRPADNHLFLHDAIYDLFDQYSTGLDTGNGEISYWFRRIYEFYQSSENNSRQATAVINQLYYCLRFDSIEAFYKIFALWSDISIKGFEIELEAQLSDEVRRYLDNWIGSKRSSGQELTKILYQQDNIVRWLLRLIHRSRYEQAAELAETILLSSPVEYKTFMIGVFPSKKIPSAQKIYIDSIVSTADSFFWGHLLTYYGEALTYLPGQDEAGVRNILNKAIDILNNLDVDQNNQLWWFKNRLMGRAYDRLGYLARVKGDFIDAKTNYQRATPFFMKINFDDEFAFTQNNLAFVLALVGDIKNAKIAAGKSFEIRNKLGQRFPLALSFNTRGLIEALANPNDVTGEQDCKMALSIFEDINIPRGIGLACNALGYILRQRGNGWVSKICKEEQANLWFKESEEFLERAKDLFKDGEKIRLWEAYNELGSLYRYWGRLLRVSNLSQLTAEKFDKAIENHNQALKLARDGGMNFQQMDTMDDLVQVYIDIGDLVKAQEYLDLCKGRLPESADLDSYRTRTQNTGILWMSVAKYEYGSGVVNISRARHANALNTDGIHQGVYQILFSYLYYRSYSSNSEYLKRKASLIVSTLGELKIPGLVVREAYQKIALMYNDNLAELNFALSQEYEYEEFQTVIVGKE